MNHWELQICERFRLLRENLRYSQPDFAAQIGITRAQVAAIEAGITPLRYRVAWRIRDRFRISLRWLADEDTTPGNYLDDNLPPPDNGKFGPRILLSKAYENADKLRDFAFKKQAKAVGPDPVAASDELDRWVTEKFKGPETKTGKPDAEYRIMMADVTKEMVDAWYSAAPIGKVEELQNALLATAKQYGGPMFTSPTAMQLQDAMRWERIRKAQLEKDLSKTASTETSGTSRKALTTKTKPALKQNGVGKTKLTLKELLHKVKLATQARGKKAELARELGVSESNISEWLRGVREPGGETTLRLLTWLNDPGH